MAMCNFGLPVGCPIDRKSTRLNSSHSQISYAVFCLKKKTLPCEGTGQPAHSRCSSLSNYLCSDYTFLRCRREDSLPKRSFHCRSTLPCDGLVQRSHW